MTISHRTSVWTEEEESLLRESAGIISAVEIATKLNRSVNAVRMKASLSGLSLALPLGTVRRMSRMDWDEEAEATLQRLAGTMTTEQIAAEMGRNQKSIQRKAAKLGISLAFQGRQDSVSRFDYSLSGTPLSPVSAPTPSPGSAPLHPVKVFRVMQVIAEERARRGIIRSDEENWADAERLLRAALYL